LIVNERESTSFLGPQSLDLTSGVLEKHDLKTLLVTRGKESTIALCQSGESLVISPPSVTPVDTVGAGDTFAGALAVALAEGNCLSTAISFANTAASLSTLKPGAQEGIPTRREIEVALGEAGPQEKRGPC
jgi:ribokinase